MRIVAIVLLPVPSTSKVSPVKGLVFSSTSNLALAFFAIATSVAPPQMSSWGSGVS
jgi:hypothetical protein